MSGASPSFLSFRSPAPALTVLAVLALALVWASCGPQAHLPLARLVRGGCLLLVLALAAAMAWRGAQLRRLLTTHEAALAQAQAANRELAHVDSLTGLVNRQAMTALLAQQRPSQRRSEGNMAVALLDIDGFKRINDAQGPLIGDAVLQRFAQLARSGLRAGDALSRWDGEEFLLLMQDTTEVEALVALERVRQRLAGGFEHLTPGLRLTFSAGLAAFPPCDTWTAVVERADQALRRAKQQGGNGDES